MRRAAFYAVLPLVLKPSFSVDCLHMMEWVQTPVCLLELACGGVMGFGDVVREGQGPFGAGRCCV